MITYNLIEVEKICNNSKELITLIHLQDFLLFYAPEIIFEYGSSCYRKMVALSENKTIELLTLKNISE